VLTKPRKMVSYGSYYRPEPRKRAEAEPAAEGRKPAAKAAVDPAA